MGLSDERIAGHRVSARRERAASASAATSLTADIHTQLASLHQQQADSLRLHELADHE